MREMQNYNFNKMNEFFKEFLSYRNECQTTLTFKCQMHEQKNFKNLFNNVASFVEFFYAKAFIFLRKRSRLTIPNFSDIYKKKNSISCF
jgi:hypothetical protein